MSGHILTLCKHAYLLCLEASWISCPTSHKPILLRQIKHLLFISPALLYFSLCLKRNNPTGSENPGNFFMHVSADIFAYILQPGQLCCERLSTHHWWLTALMYSTLLVWMSTSTVMPVTVVEYYTLPLYSSRTWLICFRMSDCELGAVYNSYLQSLTKGEKQGPWSEILWSYENVFKNHFLKAFKNH